MLILCKIHIETKLQKAETPTIGNLCLIYYPNRLMIMSLSVTTGVYVIVMSVFVIVRFTKSIGNGQT